MPAAVVIPKAQELQCVQARDKQGQQQDTGHHELDHFHQRTSLWSSRRNALGLPGDRQPPGGPAPRQTEGKQKRRGGSNLTKPASVVVGGAGLEPATSSMSITLRHFPPTSANVRSGPQTRAFA